MRAALATSRERARRVLPTPMQLEAGFELGVCRASLHAPRGSMPSGAVGPQAGPVWRAIRRVPRGNTSQVRVLPSRWCSVDAAVLQVCVLLRAHTASSCVRASRLTVAC